MKKLKLSAQKVEILKKSTQNMVILKITGDVCLPCPNCLKSYHKIIKESRRLKILFSKYFAHNAGFNGETRNLVFTPLIANKIKTKSLQKITHVSNI